jgi:hypothetical protein
MGGGGARRYTNKKEMGMKDGGWRGKWQEGCSRERGRMEDEVEGRMGNKLMERWRMEKGVGGSREKGLEVRMEEG